MASSKTTQNRADVVRDRRDVRPRKSTSRPGNRAKKSAAAPLPPVLMRGSLLGPAAAERPRGKKARRRYDVGLGIPGAEMQLPSLPGVAIGWRLLSGLLVAVLGFALYSIWNHPMFQVQSLEVQGLRRLTSADLNAVAGVIGNSILLVQPEKIQDDLRSAFPELAAVTVELKLPAGVAIQAVERRPVLIWKQGAQETWVDAEGVAFPKRDEGGPKLLVEAMDAPPAAVQPAVQPAEAESGAVADGTDSSDPLQATAAPFIPAELVQAIQVLKEEAPDKVPIIYSSLHGLGWSDSRGWQVYFGADLEELALKMRVYKAILKRLKKEGVQPSLISVEHVHAPYYRLEQ